MFPADFLRGLFIDLMIETMRASETSFFVNETT
jgi:hypothetical protein